ncbi:hypothetical protein NPIL_130931 [Nephila pilipes]|uniref:Uncharacterized protein n=1 Tax=Nephila pilipes TaxID=299642 RepID=A0A8X6NVX8_NEPPI|nr:hypothetical protein NPIL_130931 [Nephila pilipes]
MVQQEINSVEEREVLPKNTDSNSPTGYRLKEMQGDTLCTHTSQKKGFGLTTALLCGFLLIACYAAPRPHGRHSLMASLPHLCPLFLA